MGKMANKYMYESEWSVIYIAHLSSEMFRSFRRRKYLGHTFISSYIHIIIPHSIRILFYFILFHI